MIKIKTNNDTILDLFGITVDFPGTRALDNINFSLKENEIHAIVGENGAGKSTLIKVITGVHTPQSGKIILNQKEVKWKNPLESQQNGISAIYQDPMLFSELSVVLIKVDKKTNKIKIIKIKENIRNIFLFNDNKKFNSTTQS